MTLLLAWSPSLSSEANLSWTEPTQNEDGSPLTDLASYEIHYGCTQSGVYGSVETLNAPATAYTVLGLPDNGACYFAAKAVNSEGTASAYSNEATRVFGSLEVPGPVTDTAITWRESVVAAPTVAGTNSSIVDSNQTTHTHSLPASISSGDLLIGQFVTGDVVVTVPSGWTEFQNDINEGDSQVSWAWRDADGDEGATAAWTTASGVRSACKVFRITGAADPTTAPPEGTGTNGGADKNPDAPSHTPSGGSDDYLWLVGASDNRDQAASAYPYGAGNEENVTGSGTVALYSDWKTATASVEDPGAWTVGLNSRWAASTVSVAPAAAGGGAPENFLTLLGVGH